MNISIDFAGCYEEYKPFFDEMALAMQAKGHKVGIITGEREAKKDFIRSRLGFEPDFWALWGEYITIGNGNLWKAQRMDEFDVWVHFDDDAGEIKKYTDRWVFKSLNSGQPNKFLDQRI